MVEDHALDGDWADWRGGLAACVGGSFNLRAGKDQAGTPCERGNPNDE
jgi:hypothetical protein